MKHFVTLFLLAALAFGCAKLRHKPSAAAVSLPSPGPGIFFVATNGNDAWTGTVATPDRKGDGPFATVSRAIQAVRDWRSKLSAQTHYASAIFLRAGTYFLTSPIELNSGDSDMLIATVPGEQAIISGGRLLTGWQETTLGGKAAWVAPVPGVKDADWAFRELWVNGKRAVRSRQPNKGYLAIAELPDKAKEWTDGQHRFKFHENDLKASPTITNAEAVVMTRWVECRLPVSNVEDQEHIINFSKRSVFELASGDLYYLEGAPEFLDEPGEWWLDVGAEKLYYLPKPGESIKQIEIIAPKLTRILTAKGEPDAGKRLERVSFKGLTFSHTEWCYSDHPTAGQPGAETGGFGQAAIGVPSSVSCEYIRDCVFQNCRFLNLGTYALELGRGCDRNRVLGSEFGYLGAGGIKIGETVIRTNEVDQTRANEIRNCHIHDGGKMFHSAIGVWIGQSPDNKVIHNLIHDFYYTGISVGWTWGYGPALATNTTVEYNHVHHIGILSDGDGPILSDMAGIYTLGKQSGTTIRNNLWHDMAATRYGGWGIYFDEGTSGAVAESNIVYRTTHGGFHQHYGETNLLRNNIFAFGRDQQLQRTRPEQHSSFTITTNIVYFNSGVLLGGDWSGDKYVIERNLYFDARPGVKLDNFPFGQGTAIEWVRRGHDRYSVFGDPQFMDPANGDFRLKLNSAAFRIGFGPIDTTSIGIQSTSE